MARELEEAYAEYNRRYYANTLPDVKVRWGKTPRGDLAIFRWSSAGGTDGVITLSPRLKFSSRVWQMTLLHEMCHVALCDHESHAEQNHERMHGEPFRLEGRRLMDAGALDALF